MPPKRKCCKKEVITEDDPLFHMYNEPLSRFHLLKGVDTLKTITRDQITDLPLIVGDLLPDPVFWTMTKKKRVDDMITEADIKNPLLKQIYAGKYEEAENTLREISWNQCWDRDFQFDLLMAFWLSLHQESIILVKRCLDYDIYLRQLISIAWKQIQEESTDEVVEKPRGWKPRKNVDINNLFVNMMQGDEKSGLFEGGSESDDQMSEYDSEEQSESEKPSEDLRQVESYIPPKMFSSEELFSLEQENMSQINEQDEDMQGDMNRAPIVEMNNPNHEQWLFNIGVTGLDIENTEIVDQQDILNLKNQFRLKFPVLMANIIKILLFRNEEKLACLLTAYYEISIDKGLLFQAIYNKQYEWLQTVWALHKNFFGTRKIGKNNKPEMNDQFIPFVKIFETIKTILEDNDEKIETAFNIIADWRVFTEDNILDSLLTCRKETLAIKFMGPYDHFLTQELFLNALRNGNDTFVKESLLAGAFSKQVLGSDDVIENILTYMEDGSKTNLILNVLLLIDVTSWKIQQLIELLSMLENFSTTTYESNRLILSSNPMMTIALTAEILAKIAKTRKRFQDQAMNLKTDILALGKVYAGKIENEAYYKELIEDRDFKNRTVLNIICYQSFQPLMSEEDPKAINLIQNIWQGSEATRCDGNLFGYSTLYHILGSKAKKVTGSGNQFMTIVTNQFEPDRKVDYTFQYRYRCKSIKNFFWKETLFALIMVAIFQTYNIGYSSNFKGVQTYFNTTTALDGSEKVTIAGYDIKNGMYDFYLTEKTPQVYNETIRVENVEVNLQDYREKQYLVIAMASTLCLSFVLKLLFNFCNVLQQDTEIVVQPYADEKVEAHRFKMGGKVPIDKWQMMDITCAAFTLTAVILITSQPISSFVNTTTKQMFDYIIVGLMMVQWMRFYMFFLVIQQVSPMILTLIGMIKDTMAFMFIVTCYILIMSAVFTTLFQDVNSNYKTITYSARTLFDCVMAAYSYTGMKEQENVHQLMLLGHIFMAHILLLNYLIAILSGTYVIFLESGTFLFKVSLYQYCERYLIAFGNPAYGEVVLHPAPVCAISTLILPFQLLLPAQYVQHFSKALSYTMFWLENIVYLTLFFGVELLMIPFVYFKNIPIIAWATKGLFTTAFYVILWLLTGPLVALFLAFRDVYYLWYLLKLHRGCKAAAGMVDELQREEPDEHQEKQLFNEARNTVTELYFEKLKELKGEQVKSNKDEKQEEIDYENIAIREKIIEDTEWLQQKAIQDAKEAVEQADQKNYDEFFIIKLNTILDEWRKKKGKKLALSKKKTEADIKAEEKSKIAQEKYMAELAKEEEKSNQKDGTKKDFLNRELLTKTGQYAEEITKAFVNKQAIEDEKEEEEDPEESEEIPLNADEQEVAIVQSFLEKFLIGSESTFLDNIDIRLMLRAIPTKIEILDLPKYKKIKFHVLQSSIIAFLNEDQVTAFEFFDKRNRERVNNVQNLILSQKTKLHKVNEIMTDVKERVQRNEEIYREYEEMWQAAQDEKADQQRMLQQRLKEEEEAAIAKRREQDKKKGRKKKGGQPRKTAV